MTRKQLLRFIELYNKVPYAKRSLGLAQEAASNAGFRLSEFEDYGPTTNGDGIYRTPTPHGTMIEVNGVLRLEEHSLPEKSAGMSDDDCKAAIKRWEATKHIEAMPKDEQIKAPHNTIQSNKDAPTSGVDWGKLSVDSLNNPKNR